MGVIRRLPDSLSRRISAGEVIERPLSVVKELMENSIDAGAKTVTVELIQGGRVLISVKDDGCGMSPDDLPLAVEKHATSKIFSDDDLDRILTLGYRGEALASVAAVSGLEIYSRRAELSEGASLRCENGTVSVTPTGLQPGTTVVVKDLFYNLPARRKFLRSAQSESRRVSSLIKDYAFAYPHISFTLINDGKRTFQTAGSGSIEKLLDQLWGNEPEVKYSQEQALSSSVRIWWQDLGPQSRMQLITFVNGRRVSNPAIRSSLQSFNWASRGNWLLMLTLPPEDIDVNIHPAKSEILLRHSGEVYSLVRKAAEKLSKSYSPYPVRSGAGADEDLVSQTSSSPFSGSRAFEKFDLTPGMDSDEVSSFKIDTPASSSRGAYVPEHESHPFSRVSGPFMRSTSPETAAPLTPRLRFEPETAEAERIKKPAPEAPDIMLLGQMPQGYLVFADADGLLLIDPHAAHERINYERILKSCWQPHGEEQMLVPVALPPTLREDAMARREELSELKFVLTDDGELASMPLHPKALGLSPIDLLRSALSAIEEGGEPGKLLDVFATKACKASVKLTTRLASEECYKLMDDLGACDEPNACPHGRPTVLRLSVNALDKHFGRLGL